MCKRCSFFRCKCPSKPVEQVNNINFGKNNGTSIPGLSAYQIAVNKKLFEGTEEEFIEWLKGPAGKSAYQSAISTGVFNGTEAEFVQSLKGADGKSAYQLTVDSGLFNGTLVQFINSLKGETGKSAYEIAVITGIYNGPEAGFIDFLKGQNGKSAYEVAIETGIFSGTAAEFVNWLRPDDGEDGKSAYQMAVELQGFGGTEIEYLQSLKGDKGDTPKFSEFTSEEKAEIKGDKGDTGIGWTPVIANVIDILSDPPRVVQKLADYIGGTGDKPIIVGDVYLGPNGWTTDVNEATNIAPTGSIGGGEGIDTSGLVARTEIENIPTDYYEDITPATSAGKINADTGAYNSNSSYHSIGFLGTTPGEELLITAKVGDYASSEVGSQVGVAGYGSNTLSSYITTKDDKGINIGNLLSKKRYDADHGTDVPKDTGFFQYKVIVPTGVNFIRGTSSPDKGVPLKIYRKVTNGNLVNTISKISTRPAFKLYNTNPLSNVKEIEVWLGLKDDYLAEDRDTNVLGLLY